MATRSGSDSNIIQMKVNDMVDLMVPLYATSKPTEIPALMLWGQPGIGKSQSVRAIAKKLEQTCPGKKVSITDVRLLLFNPVDLRGIPTADVNKEFAKWLKPEIFKMNESPDIINILILDEISAAPQSVQAAAYQITLDRIIGEHKLPDNCIVMAAGNRVTDKSVAYKMPKALGNRMTHIEIICEMEDWKRWALPAGIDPKITGYLSQYPTRLNKFDPSNDDNAYPTPRSWEMVHKYLSKINSVENAFPLIAGSIGLAEAASFKAWTKVFNDLPDIKAIFAGTETKQPPTSPDTLYALTSSIVAYAPKVDKKGLQNMLKYLNGMTKEFSTLCIKDLVVIDDVRNKILTLPEWIDWSRNHKTLIM